MTKKYLQPGNVFDHVAAAPIASGDVVVFPDMIGVALTDIATGEEGSVGVSGVFEINTLSTDVVAQGAQLYWDATPGELTLVSTANTPAGKAAAAAGSGATTVLIALNI